MRLLLTLPVAFFATLFPGLVLAQAVSSAGGENGLTPVLASYDFEEPTPSGPDTFWLREREGSVNLSSAFKVSGERSLHLREVPGDRDFSEFLVYFDERREGVVFVRYSIAEMKKPADEDALHDTWTVRYWDHSGNSYRFWQDDSGQDARFVYDPVTPENSSSGTYSGGDPQEGTLDSSQVAILFRQVRDLEADTGSHTKTRMMGTGSFRVSEGGGASRQFIVRAGSKRQAFDAFVRPFRLDPNTG